jgi:hypothetical protein
MLIPLKDSKLGQYLECPVCEETSHHIKCVGTELDPSGDETTLYPGTAIVFERATGERRSAVRIDLSGECGHDWSLILQQHKGMIQVYARIAPERWLSTEAALSQDSRLLERTQRVICLAPTN